MTAGPPGQAVGRGTAWDHGTRKGPGRLQASPGFTPLLGESMYFLKAHLFFPNTSNCPLLIHGLRQFLYKDENL